MPPRIATEHRTSRSVSASPSSATPPSAVIAGTLSWTVAALVACRPFRADYQIA